MFGIIQLSDGYHPFYIRIRYPDKISELYLISENNIEITTPTSFDRTGTIYTLAASAVDSDPLFILGPKNQVL